jgi:hypothetical protein
MKMRTVIQVFLASPSDVTHERTVTQGVVAEINRNMARELSIMVDLLRWEDMIPGMGRPEQVILDQADIDQSDVFIGILWNRFGTPTGKADSGTEEEFQIAYESWLNHGKPHILFYFCQRPANFERDEELQQKSKVLTFRKQLSTAGIIREFQTCEDFERALRQDMTKHLLGLRMQLATGHEKDSGTPRICPQTTDAAVADDAIPSESLPERMIRIPAGELLHGPSSEKAVIEHTFSLDEVPVTNAEFHTFMEQTGFMLSRPGSGIREVVVRLREAAKNRPDHPVTIESLHNNGSSL